MTRRAILWLLPRLLALAALVLIAELILSAPRGASGAPYPAAKEEIAASRAGSIAAPSRSARPTPKVDASSCLTPCYVDIGYLVRTGIASTYGPSFSEWWVALPDGPGWRFLVCGPGACRELVSTDAGPSKAMQRPPFNRVVDLPIGAFSAVCGVPWWYGLCDVEVTLIGRVR